MTGSIRQRVPLPPADERAMPRGGAMPRHEVAVAGGVLPGVPRCGACGVVSLPQVSACVRDGVAVVSLRGELDSFGAGVLRAHLSGTLRGAWACCVVDLAELVCMDRLCLGVLVRHCREVRGQGGSFALAGPQPAVRRVLSATGLLSWFEVHDTVEEAVCGAGGRRPAG